MGFGTLPAYAGTAFASWDLPNDPAIAGSIIYYGTQSGVYTQSVNVGPTDFWQFDSLADNTTYYFAVVDYDLLGNQSPLSNETAYTTPVVTQPLSLAMPGQILLNIAALRSTNLLNWTPTNFYIVLSNTGPTEFFRFATNNPATITAQ